jgi:hypothetical protein
VATETLSPVLKQKFFGNDGKPLNGGKLFSYATLSSTKIATYQDAAGASPNANPVILDYRGEANVFIPPNTSYKFVLAPANDTDPPTNPIWSIDPVVNSQLLTLYGGVDTGAANAYILTFVAQFSAYTDGIIIYWIPANTNTGPSTINVNGLGAVAIINQDGSVLRPGQIIANNVVGILYKGTGFILLNVNAVGLTPSVNTKNANYTFAIVDAYNIVLHTDASVWTYTVPADATTNFSIGTSIEVINQSGTTLVVSPAGGVSLYPYGGFGSSGLASGSLTLNAATATFITKTAANTWEQTTITSIGATGSYTGTITGMTAGITGTVFCASLNGIAQVYINVNLVGVSNSTAMTLTGMPVAFRPSVARTCISVGMRDNGVDSIGGVASVATTGVITFGKGIDNATAGFTNVNGKGLLAGWMIEYPL